MKAVFIVVLASCLGGVICQQIFEHQVGKGKVFGEVGDGISGKAGYKAPLNNNWDGAAYGQKTLGEPSRVGTRFDYHKADRTSGYVDVNRNLRGKPNWQGEAGVHHKIGPNTDLGAGAFYNGRHDYGGRAGIIHRF